MWHKRVFLSLRGVPGSTCLTWFCGLRSWMQELSPSLSWSWLSEFCFPSRSPSFSALHLRESACVCVGGGGQTLAPFDPVSAFNLRGGMRGFLRPEEAAVGGGSYDAQRGCHPASRRLSNFTFSRNGVRRSACGAGAAGGRKRVFLKGPRSGPEHRGTPNMGQTAVSAVSQAASGECP